MNAQLDAALAQLNLKPGETYRTNPFSRERKRALRECGQLGDSEDVT